MQPLDQGIIYCLERAYRKRLANFLLREIEMSPQQILGSGMWESITSTVIQNCFSKCGFGIEDAVVTEEDDQDNSDWVELQGHVIAPATLMSF
jgi:hypothetical protein